MDARACETGHPVPRNAKGVRDVADTSDAESKVQFRGYRREREHKQLDVFLVIAPLSKQVAAASAKCAKNIQK